MTHMLSSLANGRMVVALEVGWRDSDPKDRRASLTRFSRRRAATTWTRFRTRRSSAPRSFSERSRGSYLSCGPPARPLASCTRWPRNKASTGTAFNRLTGGKRVSSVSRRQTSSRFDTSLVLLSQNSRMRARSRHWQVRQLVDVKQGKSAD